MMEEIPNHFKTLAKSTDCSTIFFFINLTTSLNYRLSLVYTKKTALASGKRGSERDKKKQN
jgi:hypothetical protein